MTDSSRYLCLNLGTEEFALPLLDIKEVIGMPEVTPVPQSPAHFAGIVNLRGQIISVMDLRTKLGIKATKSEETSVIILDLKEFSMGIIVDRVNSVQVLKDKELAEKPMVDSSKAHDYILGVFRREEKLILLLDIKKALSLEDKKLISHQTKKAA